MKIELFSLNKELHLDSDTSKKESTRINLSMNFKRRYNSSLFFSQIKIVLNPSSVAPCKTCSEQCEPRVAIDAKLYY